MTQYGLFDDRDDPRTPRERFDGARPRAAFRPLRDTDNNSHITVVA